MPGGIAKRNIAARRHARAGKRGYVNLLALPIGLASPALQPAWAQQFSTKPVRMIIGSAPGSGNDIAARIVMAKVPALAPDPLARRAGAPCQTACCGRGGKVVHNLKLQIH